MIRHLLRAGILVAGAAVFVAAGAILLGAAFSQPGQASAGLTLGIDADATGNTATSLGTIDACREVTVGQAFDVDIYVVDVVGIQGFDIRVAYDSTLLEATATDIQYLSGGIDASALDNPGGNPASYLLASGATSPSSGTGVLARVTFNALAAGDSPVYIRMDGAFGAELHSQNGNLGDVDSNGKYDGPVTNARIAINQSCSDATPVPTLSPPPMITPSPPVTPSPSPTPTPTPTVGGSSQTPTPQPTCFNFCQTPTPTPTPGGRDIAWGDVDCNGDVGTSDVMYIIRYQAGFAVSPVSLPCPGIGGPVIGTSPLVNWGDVDCLGGFNPGDAIAIMRYLSVLDVGAPETCPRIAVNFVLIY